MKRALAIFLCLLMFLMATGCKGNEPEQTTPPTTQATVPPTTVPPTTVPPTTVPPETEPPAPSSLPGIALTDHVVVIQTFLDRGAAVEIVGEFDDKYYVVRTDEGYGLIEKLIVRLEGQEPYTAWTGFARSGAKLYTGYHLPKDGTRDLAMNTTIQVLELFNDICLVQVDGEYGYMLKSEISTTRIVYTPSEDGGDISLGFQGGVNLLATFAPAEGEVTGTATVLVDAAEVLVGWFDLGEAINLVTDIDFAQTREGYLVAYQDGLWGYVAANLVAYETDEPYTQWSGFAKGGVGFYDNYHLAGEPSKNLSVNTEIKVLADLGNCLLVLVDGTLGYMISDAVSTTRIVYSNQGGEWSPPQM